MCSIGNSRIAVLNANSSLPQMKTLSEEEIHLRLYLRNGYGGPFIIILWLPESDFKVTADLAAICVLLYEFVPQNLIIIGGESFYHL